MDTKLDNLNYVLYRSNCCAYMDPINCISLVAVRLVQNAFHRDVYLCFNKKCYHIVGTFFLSHLSRSLQLFVYSLIGVCFACF